MVPWKCPNCNTTYQYHPMPCPICEAVKAVAGIDMSGVRAAAASIHVGKAKKDEGTDLSNVATWKKGKGK